MENFIEFSCELKLPFNANDFMKYKHKLVNYRLDGKQWRIESVSRDVLPLDNPPNTMTLILKRKQLIK